MKKNLLLILTILFIGMTFTSCKKEAVEEPPPPPPQPVVLKDFDGNVYKTVTIGTQTWMAENLKTTRSNTGAAITSYPPNNDEANVASFGRLYVWADAKACVPDGWHLPTQDDWNTLFTFLGGTAVAGGKMKHTTLWGTASPGATNSSGFGAVGAGYRITFPVGGLFIFAFRTYTGFWTEKDNAGTVNVPTFGSDRDNVLVISQGEMLGYSVRFVKN
jgi:uncharacterized protein (TIGR02145 family)